MNRHYWKKKKGFYRYSIENRKGKFRLKIGTIEDSGPHEYGYVSTTYFAKLCAIAGETFDSAIEAQAALAALKEMIANHPLYSQIV